MSESVSVPAGTLGRVHVAAPDAPPPLLERPVRAPGVDLLGPVEGSGYEEKRFLVCLGGGRYIHATPRLYHVLRHADGRTSVEEIARRISVETGLRVEAADVRWLLRKRLAPAGLVVDASPATSHVGENAGAAHVASRTPLLAIRQRLPLLPYRVTGPVTARLQLLYAPPVVAAVVIAAAAVTLRLYLGPELRSGFQTLLLRPELVLFLLVLDVPLRLWHELGHASAMRRAGAPHGDIGVALYIILPVYYTDVTHAYRLPRADRIRVDLGGMYFDLMSVIGLYAAYRATGLVILLPAMVLIGFNILREFTPFMRFDGYYLLADVLGVHEPLTLLGPTVRDLLPGRSHRRPSGLTRRTRLWLSVYLIVVLAFLLRPLILMAALGWSSIISAIGNSGRLLWNQLEWAWRHHDVIAVVTGVLQLAFWSLVPIGLSLFCIALGRLVVRGAPMLMRRTRRSPAPAASAAPEQTHSHDDAGHPPVNAPDPGPAAEDPATPDAPAAEPHDSAQPTAVTGSPDPPLTSDGNEPPLMEDVGDIREAMGRLFRDVLAIKDREIDTLRARLRDTERDRDTVEASLRRLESAFGRQVSELLALSEDVTRRAELARRERDATLAASRRQ